MTCLLYKCDKCDICNSKTNVSSKYVFMLSFSLWGNGKSREFQSTTFKLQLALTKVSVGLMSTGRGRGVLVEQTAGELVHVLVAIRP